MKGDWPSTNSTSIEVLVYDPQEEALAEELCTVSNRDVNALIEKGREYGDSWKRRGGQGAFMMLARKWDRLEQIAQRNHYDIFEVGLRDRRDEGVLDDIRDLRRYLMLVEVEIERRVREECGADASYTGQ